MSDRNCADVIRMRTRHATKNVIGGIFSGDHECEFNFPKLARESSRCTARLRTSFSVSFLSSRDSQGEDEHVPLDSSPVVERNTIGTNNFGDVIEIARVFFITAIVLIAKYFKI